MDYSEHLSNTFGFISLEELELLKKFISQSDSKAVVLDLGTGSGTTLTAVLEESPQAKITTVDNKPSSAEGRMHEAGFSCENVSFVVEDSLKAAEFWDTPVDFIIFDLDVPDNTLEDHIRAWAAHLKVGAYFAMHDYGEKFSSWENKKKILDKFARYNGLKLQEQVGCLAIFKKYSTKRGRKK